LKNIKSQLKMSNLTLTRIFAHAQAYPEDPVVVVHEVIDREGITTKY
jgi:hypothetical protein